MWDKAVTLYIVPAEMPEIAGQCRIVAQPGSCKEPRDDYRTHPEAWAEVGLMSSSGRLVCLEAPAEVFQDLKSQEPLMAGVIFRYGT